MKPNRTNPSKSRLTKRVQRRRLDKWKRMQKQSQSTPVVHKGEVKMMYVYIRSEPGLWTVGFYTPEGKWEPESDHDNREDAAKRVAWLNGSKQSWQEIQQEN